MALVVPLLAACTPAQDSAAPNQANPAARDADAGTVTLAVSQAADAGASVVAVEPPPENVIALHYVEGDEYVALTEQHVFVVDTVEGKRTRESLPVEGRRFTELCDDSLVFRTESNAVGLVTVAPLVEEFRVAGSDSAAFGDRFGISSKGVSRCAVTELDASGRAVAVAFVPPPSRSASVFRLAFPADLLASPKDQLEVVGVDPAAFGHFAIANVAVDVRLGSAPSRVSLVYDLRSTVPTVVARLPLADSHLPSRAAVYTATERIAFEDHAIVKRDLATGRVAARSTFACASSRRTGAERHGLVLSANGENLVATCGRDLVVLDPKTLARTRTVARFLPASTGEDLVGTFKGTTSTLVSVVDSVGETRIDTQTGRFECTDAKDLAANRANVPRCLPEGTVGTMKLCPTGRCVISEGDSQGRTVLFGEHGAVFEISRKASAWSVAPDGDRIAEANGSHVLVRETASGKVLRDDAF